MPRCRRIPTVGRGGRIHLPAQGMVSTAKLAVSASKFAHNEMDMMEGMKRGLSGTSGRLGYQESKSQFVNGEEEAVTRGERRTGGTLYIPAEATTDTFRHGLESKPKAGRRRLRKRAIGKLFVNHIGT